MSKNNELENSPMHTSGGPDEIENSPMNTSGGPDEIENSAMHSPTSRVPAELEN